LRWTVHSFALTDDIPHPHAHTDGFSVALAHTNTAPGGKDRPAN
jgi:hypothetical protein